MHLFVRSYHYGDCTISGKLDFSFCTVSCDVSHQHNAICSSKYGVLHEFDYYFDQNNVMHQYSYDGKKSTIFHQSCLAVSHEVGH